MNAVKLTEDRRKDFIDYCKAHRSEVDYSFLYEDDLDKFQVGQDNPTYIVSDKEDKIVTTASIMIDENGRRSKKAGFRIFHSELSDAGIYESLLQNIVKHTEGFDKINAYVPLHNDKLMEHIVDVHFLVERYIFLMVRKANPVPEINLLEDYTIRPLKPDYDEETWCQVRNAAFATLKGNEKPITPDRAKEMLLSNDYIEGGCMILYHKDKAVGCVRCSMDEHEDAPMVNIGPLAVIPEYQAKGLGRILLRAGLRFAIDESCGRTFYV